MKQKNNQIDRELLWREWKDSQTGIKGFLSVFGSGKTKASGGGIRVSPTITSEITKQIAKIMRNKFFITGAGDIETREPIDGAGIGLCAKPEQITPDILLRFLKETKCVNNGIGAAASTGISIKGVCRNLGIVHLQEPIARAINKDKQILQKAKKSLIMTNKHVEKPLSLRHFSPSNLATGLSASEIININFLRLKGIRIGMIGFGAVGGSFAHRAVELGAEIVFVANSEGAIPVTHSKHTIPQLLQKIRKETTPVPRLHLKDITQPVLLEKIVRTRSFDILVMACTEGVIDTETAMAIPEKTLIVSIANMPWSIDAQKTAEKRFKIFPPSTINLGNATLFSLACLGCRAESPNELLNKTIQSAIELSTHPVWHEVIPKFL